MRYALAALLLLVWTLDADAEIKTSTIKYKVGQTEHVGYLAYDDAQDGKRPGVLVLHEWWGLNDYARKRAEMLAKEGYVAFAADMYGEGKSVEHPADAGAMAGKVRSNAADWRKRAVAGLDALKDQPQCDAEKLAAIGYCFGGSTALQLAFAGADLDVVASFHGALMTPTPQEVKAIKPRILIFHGADDTFIPQAAIDGFRKALDAGKAKYEFTAYPGAKHSFTVEGVDKKGVQGLEYNREADEKSWSRLTEVLAQELK